MRASVSTNGTSWTFFTQARIDGFDPTLSTMVGFANASGTSGTLSRATLGNVKFLPANHQGVNLKAWMENFSISPERFMRGEPTPADNDCADADGVQLHGGGDIAEGCVTEGDHTLMRFDFLSHNVGRGDLHTGSPQERPDLFQFSGGDGHNHFHFGGYNLYSMRNSQGQVVQSSQKQSFCLKNTDGFEDWPGQSPPEYNCLDQGIAAGYADRYEAFLGCQYVVLDDTCWWTRSIRGPAASRPSELCSWPSTGAR